ncbi:hypothetical protein BDZ91DRAFT_778193 [Kalaharituber pfeilii]|nr:hypothetical protein BDZ91DRAFT_778193 [Kalaharituber pfeilii]
MPQKEIQTIATLEFSRITYLDIEEMRHPVQRIYYCAKTQFLYAGVGGTIQVFDTTSGSLLSQWEAPEVSSPGVIPQNKKKQGQKQAANPAPGNGYTVQKINANGNAQIESIGTATDEGAAAKKRKVDDITSSPKISPAKAATETLTPPQDVTKVTVTAIVESSQKRKKSGVSEGTGSLGWQARKDTNLVTNIVGTTSGRYLVVATNEDKAVRVFNVSALAKGREKLVLEEGKKVKRDDELQLLSERHMPKRLCALRLLENKLNMTEEEEVDIDGVVIICADKFGDVYSLPLIYTPGKTPTLAPGTTPDSNIISQPKIAGGGIITTERNKKAAQKAAKIVSRDSIANLEAKELPFKHKLLLGHVSLLIDVLPVTLKMELDGGKMLERTWILSADKDEHIRVSRYPHSYVIEGFCLGHTSYVAKLLVPSWDKRTLISGGGDEYLLRWNWLEGKILQKIDLKEPVSKALETVKQNKAKIRESKIRRGAMDVDREETKADEEFQISVTGLWEYRNEETRRQQVLVSVEGLPVLIVFADNGSDGCRYSTTVGTLGNVLDVAIIDSPSGTRIWVSVDSQSTPHLLASADDNRDILIHCPEGFDDAVPRQDTSTSAGNVAAEVNNFLSWEISAEQNDKLHDFFYGAKNLRKFEAEGAE